VEEDQHATTAVTVSTTVVFSFILVIGLVGVPVLIKCHSCTKKHKREKNHKMSRKLSLPPRAIYQGFEEVHDLAVNDTGWEMSHDDLELQGSLGMGQFGDVKLAFLKSTPCTDRIRSYIDRMKGAGESLSTCRTVAVKFLRGTTTAESKILFLQEINLMKKVSSVGSRHVIQLIGCIVSETPMAMVMEYAPFGDLHGNLIKWREELGTHSTYIKPLSGSISDLPSAILDKDQQYVQEALKEDDLFSFAHQIAIGMSYLASMNVIHRDLACRNVLVGENKILKVSDFGLSKEVDGIYTSTSKTKLPLQWMSPEAISHRLFSEKSDVWSYGVCLWEICTLGAVPFGHKSNAEVAASVAKSVFLERPRTCHDQIYKLMLECWKMNASDRPTFRDIENYFEDLIVNKYNHLYITIYDIPEAHDIEDAPNLDPVQQTEEA
jgi:proto-oncogene tyrosine-protein kinase Ret